MRKTTIKCEGECPGDETGLVIKATVNKDVASSYYSLSLHITFHAELVVAIRDYRYVGPLFPSVLKDKVVPNINFNRPFT